MLIVSSVRTATLIARPRLSIWNELHLALRLFPSVHPSAFMADLKPAHFSFAEIRSVPK